MRKIQGGWVGGEHHMRSIKYILKSFSILLTPVFWNYAAAMCVVQPYLHLINTINMQFNYYENRLRQLLCKITT